MNYSESYQKTRDIDWFFKFRDCNIHVASNGGKLPDFVNDVLRLRNEQAIVSLLASSVASQTIIVNQRYVDARVQETLKNASNYQYEGFDFAILRESYLTSFKEMASKGFYSYDRQLGEDSEYVLICYPSEGVDLSKLINLLDATDEIVFTGESLQSFTVRTKYSDQQCD